MKNRTFIGVICIVLAVLTTFVVSPMINRMTEGKTDAVRFTKDLAQGVQITEDDIEVVSLVKSSLPENYISDKTEVIGMFASSELYKGDIATQAKLTADANASVNILNALSGDKVAMSITISSFARGLSAKLENGDIVSIYVTDKEGKTTIPQTLKYVRVITTTTAGGVDENEVEPNEDGTFDLPTTITVLVSVSQAQELAGYEENAKMHVALVYRGDEETARKFLEQQDEVLGITRPAEPDGNGGENDG